LYQSTFKNQNMGSVASGTVRNVWRLGPSPIHGTGVLVNRQVNAGSLIGVGIGYRLGVIPSITSDFGVWINHSYKPTASLLFLNNNYWIVANRNLYANEEVTVDYRKTPWYVRGPESHYV